ncbi:MAG: hypothetical protein RR386_03545 [Bacteroidaceae bacterium]
MSNLDDELLKDAEDDAKTVAFIQNYLPQELKEKFSEDQIYYILDVIVEYYATSGVLDATPDKNGYIDIDAEAITAYVVMKARDEKMGTFLPEEVLFIVQGEMEYAEQYGEE